MSVPILVEVTKTGPAPTKEEMSKFYEGRTAKWWMPHVVVFVDKLPYTATGKLFTRTLREKFKNYLLPGT